jgi:DNA-binding transcriptional LysR family regulator
VGAPPQIGLAELVDEPWIFGAGDTWHRAMIAEIFQGQGLSLPKASVTTKSILLRARLIAAGPYLTMFVSSVVRRLAADHYAVKALAIDLRAKPLSARIVTLKRRTLSPVVERFLACVREVAKSIARNPVGRWEGPPKAL